MPAINPPSTLPVLRADRVASRGDYPAIVTADETLSYRQLDRRTAEIARALLAAGVGNGSRFGLLTPDGVYWVTNFLAALRIGAVVTTISTQSTGPELAYILRYSDVQCLIATRRFLNYDYGATLTVALPTLASSKSTSLWLPEAPYLRRVWLDEAAGLEWANLSITLLRWRMV